MSGVTLTLNPKVVARLRDAAMDAVEDLAHFGMGLAVDEVPIEEAMLAGTGQVSVDRRAGVAQLSFDGPYAIVQHEDQSLNHDPGRKAKYLEDPMRTQVAPVAEQRIAEHVRRVAF